MPKKPAGHNGPTQKAAGFLALVALLSLAFSDVVVSPQAHASSDPDDCTPSAPIVAGGAYQVTSAGELKHIANDDSLWSEDFLLLNDISLANCGNWLPIGNSATKFTGTFDGGEKAISGLLITFQDPGNPIDEEIGLFGWSDDASFHNLNLVGVDVTGRSKVGGLVGRFEGTTAAHKISNSSVTGSVEGTVNDIGGLVGRFDSPLGVIENSSSSATVKGPSDVGGLVGEVDGGSIINSHATGDVTATSAQIGGLVGDFEGSGSILNSYATGAVIGFDTVGGLVGDFRNAANIEDSYATGSVVSTRTTNRALAGGLVGQFAKAGSILRSHATGDVTAAYAPVGGLVGYFFDSGNVSNSYATGTVTTQRSDAGGLVGDFHDSGDIISSHASGSVTSSGPRAGGLVGYFDTSGDIYDSYATGTVTGDSHEIGGLVGKVTAGILLSAYATGNVIATGATEAGQDVGGLVGFAENSDLRGVYATGSVTVVNPSSNGGFGGLVGRLGNSSDIVAGYATGAVVAGNYSGGLVGRLEGDSRVEISYASGAVDGSDDVGGLVGGAIDANSGIAESYASGAATGQNRVGGLVGSLSDSTSVENSYSTGRAVGDTNVGGLVGLAATGASVVNSFWDSQASQVTTSAGGLGKTSAEMLSIDTYTSVTPSWSIVPASAFGGLDPTAGEAWGIGAGVNCGYPFLYWQEFSAHSCPQRTNPSGVSGSEEKRARFAAIAMNLDANVGDKVAGASLVIGGEGLAGRSAYTLVVRSTPQVLDSGFATRLGNFSKKVILPDLPAGSHTLTLTASGSDGSILTLVQTFTVAPDGTFTSIGSPTGSQTGGLAATGVSGVGGGVGFAGLALLLGVAMVLSARRYQRTH